MNSESQRVTLEQVAAAAGVSATTAHRSISGHHSVADNTRQRVLLTARNLGYRASSHGAAHRPRVAMLTNPDVMTYPDGRPAQFWSSFTWELAASLNARQMELDILNWTARKDRISAEIILTDEDTAAAHQIPVPFGVPLIIAGGSPNCPVAQHYVTHDYAAMIHQGLQALVEIGARRPALAYFHSFTSTRRMVEAFDGWCAGANIPSVHLTELELVDRAALTRVGADSLVTNSSLGQEHCRSLGVPVAMITAHSFRQDQVVCIDLQPKQAAAIVADVAETALTSRERSTVRLPHALVTATGSSSQPMSMQPLPAEG